MTKNEDVGGTREWTREERLNLFTKEQLLDLCDSFYLEKQQAVEAVWWLYFKSSKKVKNGYMEKFGKAIPSQEPTGKLEGIMITPEMQELSLLRSTVEGWEKWYRSGPVYNVPPWLENKEEER